MDPVDTSPFVRDDTLHILPTFLRVEEAMGAALDTSPRDVVFGRNIFTFPQVMQRIYEEIPGVHTVLSPSGQLLLIDRILQDLYKDREDGYFLPLIATASLGRAVLAIINHLKSHAVAPGAFDDLASRWEGGERKKLGELAELYRRYQTGLQRFKLADTHDVNWAVHRFVADQKQQVSLLGGVRTLIIEDIYDFTPAQFDLIVAMAHRVERTTVIIPYDHDRHDLFGYVERTIRKFESLWDLTADISLDFKPQRDPSGGVVQKLSGRYLQKDGARPGGVLSAGTDVVLMETAGMYREAEAIGKEIRHLLDTGVTPHSIGVLFRDTSLYSEMIEDVFRRFRIPLYFRRGRPLLSQAVVKTILAFFSVLDSNFARDDFLKILRSNYLSGAVGGDLRAGEKMEWYFLKAGIIDDRENGWEDRLTRLIVNPKGRETAGADGVHARQSPAERDGVLKLTEHVLRIKRELELFRTPSSIGSFAAALKRLIHALGIPRTIISSPDEESVKRDSASLAAVEQILDALTTTAKQLALHHQTFTYHSFRRLLLTFIEDRFILAGRESAQGVKVLNLYESRGLTFDYLFLGGGAENPTLRKAAEDPFLNDTDKARINQVMGRKLFLLTDEIGQEESLLFYLGLASARKRLYLSYSQIDARGYPALPSFHLSEVVRLLGGPDGVRVRSDQGLIVPPFAGCYEAEELENRMALTIWSPVAGTAVETGGQGDSAQDLAAALFNQLLGQDRYRQALGKICYCAEIEQTRELFFLEGDAAGRKERTSVWTGMLNDPALLKELTTFYEKGPGRLWSPTHFERYAGCPFRFFLERVLEVSPLTLPGEEIERADEGSLVHAVLERFLTLLKRDKCLPLRGTIEEKRRIRAVAEEVYREWEEQGTPCNRDLWEIGKRRAAPLWDRFIEEESRYQDEGLLPTYFECLIGNGPKGAAAEAIPPLVFQGFDHREIVVGGKIDRIDCGAERMRVIDYKDSSSDRYYQDLLSGEKLGVVHFQIPVYVAAAKEFLAKGHAVKEVEGTFYLFRSAKRTKPAVLPGEDPFLEKDLEKRMALRGEGKRNLFNQLALIVAAAKAGDYSIFPQECTLCSYDRICRFVALPGNGQERS